jgi:hypothetical protein
MKNPHPPLSLLLVVVVLAGCGTTRTSDTKRTATEQLLISHSIDDTVSNLDFRMFCGKRVFLDPQYLANVTDKEYLISSLRQQLLASGCLLQEESKKATYIIEARSGSVGTDTNSMLVGVPQMMLPSFLPGMPGGMIPEIALAKKSNRRAVVKIAVFAYNRVNGEPVWQSGILESASREKNSWLCGAGPFQRGTLHRGTEFDEQHLVVPLLDRKAGEPNYPVVSVRQPALWKNGPLPDDDAVEEQPAQGPKSPSKDSKVIQASDDGKSE